jgi:hypothetical protein
VLLFSLFLLPLGYLRVLLLYFIDLGYVDESNVLLPVDFLQFEGAVDGGASQNVHSLLNKRKLDGFSFTTLPHYYFY